MEVNTCALVFCAFLLLGLKEVVSSQRGFCARDKCIALYQKQEDFPGAKTHCENHSGLLHEFNSTQFALILRGSSGELSGRYWVGGPNFSGHTARNKCPCISVSKDQSPLILSESCGEKLDGFLCQFTPCGDLQTGAGANVSYTPQLMDLEVIGSTTHLPGTIAVAHRVDVPFPDSKHVCASGVWIQAPWKCEVMHGGCEYSCNSTTRTCMCPSGQDLHPNNISCAIGSCAQCAHKCHQVGEAHACACREGYRLAEDGRSCEDVDECAVKDQCKVEGSQCKNTQGGFECQCDEGFYEYGCLDVSVCNKCEHLDCDIFNGEFQCKCRKGFRVSPNDPTKCEQYCGKEECEATCVTTVINNKKTSQCSCPGGYILVSINETHGYCSDLNECNDFGAQCDQCENLFGSYRCMCDEGKNLNNGVCVPEKKTEKDEESGSGQTTPNPTTASAQPASFPSYVKTGSILGITVFMGMFAVLLFFLVRHILKRCGKFQLSTLKHHEIDIFHLQQVNHETYKRLPSDRQVKNDSDVI